MRVIALLQRKGNRAGDLSLKKAFNSHPQLYQPILTGQPLRSRIIKLGHASCIWFSLSYFEVRVDSVAFFSFSLRLSTTNTMNENVTYPAVIAPIRIHSQEGSPTEEGDGLVERRGEEEMEAVESGVVKFECEDDGVGDE